MTTSKKSYSQLFLRFLHDFGLKWAHEYENLTPEEKKIFDDANPFWADFFKDRK